MIRTRVSIESNTGTVLTDIEAQLLRACRRDLLLIKATNLRPEVAHPESISSARPRGRVRRERGGDHPTNSARRQDRVAKVRMILTATGSPPRTSIAPHETTPTHRTKETL